MVDLAKYSWKIWFPEENSLFSNYGHKLCQVAVVSGFDPREDTKTGTAAAPINIRDCAHI